MAEAGVPGTHNEAARNGLAARNGQAAGASPAARETTPGRTAPASRETTLSGAPPALGVGGGARPALGGLPPLRPLPTAAERAAELIRDNIFDGRFAPGTPLPEAALAEALQISRNTVREAFRTLTADHLLSYEAHKGVVVRALSPDDVRDIYRLRRMFELSALDLAVETLELAGIATMVAEAEELAAAGRWREVGTANLRFHEVIVGIHRSARITEVFRRLMTELRLGFLAVDDLAEFHGAFLARNRAILQALASGRLGEARAELAAYLGDAEAMVVTAVVSA